MNQTSFKL